MIGKTLGHYEITDSLGKGGMGEVYLARDTRLGRKVALKFPAAEIARDHESMIRFRNEARAVAELSHPNIATLFDIDESDDRPFLVMEYIEGRSLRDLISQGPLPIEDAIRIGRALAGGLAEAHSHGIVHRDIKSANVMLTAKNEPKILDFGLAHHEDATQLTRPGTTLGTIGYMSPEQAQGESVDKRSDVWSLGVVLYECLTGRLPFRGEGASVLEQVKSAAPPPPTGLRTGIPMELERAVLRCLEKDPSLRFQHADDFASELQRLLRDHESGSGSALPPAGASPIGHSRRLFIGVAVSMVVAAGIILLTMGKWGDKHPGAAANYAIAVTPFEVFGQDDGAEYLGRFLAEAIAVNLSSTESLHVLPVRARGVPDGETQRIASSVNGASTLLRLTGSVTRDSALVRMQVSLVDLEENRLLWGTQDEIGSDELPRIAISIAQQLASHLALTQPTRYEYFRYVTPSPAMAEWPMLAETIGVLQMHDVDRGMPLTERLVAEYPLEYPAHVMRMVSLIDNQYVNQTAESLDALRGGIESLTRIDPRAPIAAIVTAWFASDRDEKLGILDGLAERDDLTPSCRAHALRTRGREYSAAGRMDEAMQDLDDALRLDPANPFNYSYSATVLETAGEIEESLRRGHQHMALDPVWGAYILALQYGRLADRERALRYLTQALEFGLTGRAWVEVTDLAFLHEDPEFVSLVRLYSQRD